MTPSILTVTVNPALDVTTTTARLYPRQKLRCDAPRYDPGGGGVNVSRAIKELGGDSRAFVALGGNTGEHHRQLLERAGFNCDLWELSGATRFSLTVMEQATGLHYRFVLPGPAQEQGESQRMLARLSDIIASGFNFVVASGSLPPGIDNDFYGRLAASVRAAGSALVLDTHGEALRAALPYRPYLIRLNHFEAQEIVGGDPNIAAHVLARELIARKVAEAVIVTLGDQGAIVTTNQQQFQIRPPKVVVRSAVGAGDSFVAALTLGLSKGWSLEKASRYGVAAAAAAVTTEATELCKADAVNRYFEEIAGQLERLD